MTAAVTPWSLDISCSPKGANRIAQGFSPGKVFKTEIALKGRPNQDWLERGNIVLYISMAQSLSHLIVHAVFSTKDRRPLRQSQEIRIETYAYTAGILKNLQCHPIESLLTNDIFGNSCLAIGRPFRATLFRTLSQG